MPNMTSDKKIPAFISYMDGEYKEIKENEYLENSKNFDAEKIMKQDINNVNTIPYTYKIFEEDLYKSVFDKILNRENIFEVISQSPKKIRRPRKYKTDKTEKTEKTEEKITSQIESINNLNQDSIAIIESEVALFVKKDESQKNEEIENLEDNFENIIKPKTFRANPGLVGNKIIINNYYNIYNQSITDPRTALTLVQNFSQQFSEVDKNIVIINGMNPSTLIDEESVKPKSNF
jgi:hypothetical protein